MQSDLMLSRTMPMIFEEYFPPFGIRECEQMIHVLMEREEKMVKTHNINGRWENLYLDIHYVPELKDILLFACRAAKNLTGKNVFVPMKELGFPNNEFWFNIACKDESTRWHNHKNGSVLSGVYYLQVPKSSGNITFRQNTGTKVVQWTTISEKGKMILFDSSIQHCVPANQNQKKRISVAFNIYCLPFDEKNYLSESQSS